MTQAASGLTSELPGEERNLERDGGRISFHDTGGPGPLVVCLPGMGDLAEVYRSVAPAWAARGYRVVVPDLRGMGRSSPRWSDYSSRALAEDLLALLRLLGGGPAVLVGNSISAGTAVWTAAESPSSVRGLVLVGPFVREPHVSAFQRALFRLALAGPWGAGVWANYQSSRLYPTRPPPDIARYRDSVRSNLREPGRMAGFRRMARATHREVEPQLARVTAPTLVVMGAADPDFPDPASEAKWVAEQLHGTSILIEGAGHYPQAEFPGEFSRAVLDFLGTIGHGATGGDH